MHYKQMIGTVVPAVMLTGAIATASVIHDAPNYSYAGSKINSVVLADDFQVAGATSPAVASVWLIEITPDLPGVFEGFSGTLGWAIYPAAGTFPGAAPLAIGSDAAPTLTVVDSDVNGHEVFRADIDLAGSLSSGSLALGGGTYWFALHEGAYFSPDDGSEIRWLTSVDPLSGTRPRFDFDETAPGSAWSDIGVNVDFAYRLTAVPEPAGALLAAVGLLGAVVLVRRKRRPPKMARAQRAIELTR